MTIGAEPEKNERKVDFLTRIEKIFLTLENLLVKYRS